MSVFVRALVLSGAVCAGSWVGLGRPDAHAAIAAGRRAVGSFTHEVREAAPTAIPALEGAPRTVDASALPDPRPPVPHPNPDANAERAWLLAEGPVHPKGDGRRLVTFTFDDGPSPEMEPPLLKVLETHHVRATFFFIGGYLAGGSSRAAEVRDCAKQVAAAGHLIGNHTMDHKLLTTMPRAAAMADIDDSQTAIEKAIGRPTTLFRPPYGQLDSSLEGALHERRADLVLWSVDVEDVKKSDPEEILHGLQRQLIYKQGGIVLLHDVHAPSLKAFHRLLHWLLANKWDRQHPERPGWDIVDLEEYMRATAASPQPYANREELERARKAASKSRPASGEAGDLPSEHKEASE